jgi:hypothetical protein
LKVTSDVYAIGNNHLALNKPVDYGMMRFDGVNDYVVLPSASMPFGNEITVSFWAKWGLSTGSIPFWKLYAWSTSKFNTSGSC